MSKSKIEIQRPLSHHIIIIGYLLAPILYYIIVMLPITFLSTGTRFIPSPAIHYFDKFGYPGGLLILLYPIVAIFLYYISRISWYVFLIHSSLVILDNIYRLPKYSHSQYRITMTIMVLVFTSTIIFILQKDFRSPYLHIIQRSFRRFKRIPVDHIILLDNKPYELSDLSASGCFVPGSGLDLKLGKKVQVTFESDRLVFSCEGEVSRYCEVDGAGIHFTNISNIVSKEIKNYLVDRYSDRYYVDIKATWSTEAPTKEGMIKNISAHGCFIEIETSSYSEEDKGILETHIQGNKYIIKGKIVWIQPLSKEKNGMAIKFSSGQKALVEQIKATLVNKA